MTVEWNAPLDPDCPEVVEYETTLLEDPMTEAYAAPVDDILSAFRRKHRRACTRCQAYGAANIELA